MPASAQIRQDLVKRYLCVKKLTVTDGFTIKSVKLPRAEARFFIGELRNRQATQLVLLDEFGESWEFMCQCANGQYALSQIGAFCEAHGALPGCYFIFFADHAHIVRLAIRQQLPEDVQAAVTAARAAMLLRNSPQPKCSPSPEQQQPASPVSHPILDDPVALDEMPLVDAATAHAQHVVPPEAAAGKQALPEAARARPLQDLSNVSRPLGVSANGGKPKPPGDKQNSSPSEHAPAHAVTAADKENSQGGVTALDPACLAGRPHPLSVRTGPDSPLPMPPLYRDTSFWPPGLAGPFGVDGAFQAAWNTTGGYGPAAGSRGLAGSSEGGSNSADSAGFRATHGTGAHNHWRQGSAQRASDDAAGEAAASAPEQEQGSTGGTWRQQLQCDELMDWEVGRRMQSTQEGAAPEPAPQQQHGASGQSLMAPPDWLRQESATTQTVRLALLHHLLLQGHDQQQASAGHPVPSGRRLGGAPYGSTALPPHPRMPDRRASADAIMVDTSAEVDWHQAAAERQEQRPGSSSGVEQRRSHGSPGALARSCSSGAQPSSHTHARFGLVPALQQRGAAPGSDTAVPAVDRKEELAGRAADAPPADAPSPKRHISFWPRPPSHAPASGAVVGGPRPPPGPRRPWTGVAARLPKLRPASSPGPKPPPSAGKSLTAQDLLSDRVRFLLDADSAFLAELPMRSLALSESGAPDSGGAGGGDGSEAVQGSSSSPGAAEQPSRGGVVTTGRRMHLDAVVESGAHYACTLSLSGPSNCQAAELVGLRPFLIRRQAGVGDLLSVEVSSSCGGPRLRVQLQRRAPL
ncbi:hypothetical protein TSOC_006493 [Tetrabaena socialis]|uniref:Uncharacterized protein n=1 Tax=Tetrabaena socialis TaxID=47790 RepID=A0A2J8A3I0_9CHLO|nr:hypothetical protein TSOC_006493 [Tetrabaena socialis]|eukprot:PNH07085.1 hypothetical protein TSOC_006493 [Tetrabaena socialis]